jgi:hypothetical protein
MSFENTSFNNTVRNCVLANNGRDRCRNDWELEVDWVGEAPVGWSSSHNVIWRDPVNEPTDDAIINWGGGPQEGSGSNPECGNCVGMPPPCASTTKYFKTLAAFRAQFPQHEVGSVDAMPAFADSHSGNFIPLSSSSVIDAGDSGAGGYVPLDLRGYRRHDAQAREPNTGTGTINYADIGPFEFDVNDTPTEPEISIATSQTEMVVMWPSTQYNGDESSFYQVFFGSGVPSGSPAPPGGNNCVRITGLTPCAIFPVYVTITDVNTGLSSSSTPVNVQTQCSGPVGIECASFRPLHGLTAGDEEGSAGAEDHPLSLECRVGMAGGGRQVVYAVPRTLAGAPLDLGVFDVAGRRIVTIARGAVKAGRFSAPLAGEQAKFKGAWVYFVRLRVGGETLRRTVVIW